MIKTLLARAYSITFVIATLSASFGVAAQEASVRVNSAQNGGESAAETAPKYNAGLNGRVKPAATKVRVQAAQNGGDSAETAYVQPKYNSALSGRAGAAPTTLAQSDKDVKTTE